MGDLVNYYKNYKSNNGYTMGSWMNHSRAQYIKKFIEEYTNEDSSVLDIGCGDGHLSSILTNRDYFGIDINVDNAITKRARCKDITEIPYDYQDKYFDSVVISEVLEHMVDPLAILKEAFRVLKDDGILITSTPNLNWIDYKFFPETFSIAYRAEHPHTWEHIRHYDIFSWEQMLSQSGFKRIKLVGCDAHYSMFFANARRVMLKNLFEEEMDLSNGVPKQTENLTIVDMLLGESFPLDSHTTMIVSRKSNQGDINESRNQ